MTAKYKLLRLGAVAARPKTFVARLILADLLAKRGEGPLERRQLIYKRARKR
jgi:hypothetical protein